MNDYRTPSQTIGPFFGFALPWREGALVVPASAPGALWLRGRLIDGQGDPVSDGLVETWQADAEGRLPEPGRASVSGFRGFGRSSTAQDGSYAIRTLKPGAVREANACYAPQILIHVFARGLLRRVITRAFFEDEMQLNEADPLFRRIGDPGLQRRLLATRSTDGYLFDIHLQGPTESVFFDV